MPKVDFYFHGFVSGANIESAMDEEGKDVDVSKMLIEELLSKLENGSILISLEDYLYSNNTNSEIELEDFESSGG